MQRVMNAVFSFLGVVLVLVLFLGLFGGTSLPKLLIAIAVGLLVGARVYLREG